MLNKLKKFFHKHCENSNFNEGYVFGTEIDALVLYKNAYLIYSIAYV